MKSNIREDVTNNNIKITTVSGNNNSTNDSSSISILDDLRSNMANINKVSNYNRSINFSYKRISNIYDNSCKSNNYNNNEYMRTSTTIQARKIPAISKTTPF